MALILGSLLLAVVDVPVKSGVFVGDHSRGFPIFLIICLILVDVVVFVGSYTTLDCLNDTTPTTSAASRTCGWAAWWLTCFSLAAAWWFFMMSFNLFVHIFQFRSLDIRHSVLTTAAIHGFGWGYSILLASVGVGVFGASSAGAVCNIDSAASDGWAYDGLFTVPIGVFGGAGLVLFVCTIVRVTWVLGRNSFKRHMRLFVFTFLYGYVLLYVLAFRGYTRAISGQVGTSFAAFAGCVAAGGDSSSCPRGVTINFPATFLGSCLNLTLLAVGLAILYALTGAPGRMLGIARNTVTTVASQIQGTSTMQSSRD
jgi:hypothetical protein